MLNLSVLIIGCGSIGLEVINRLNQDAAFKDLQVLVKQNKFEKTLADVGEKVRVVSNLANLAPFPDVVIECAGHNAVADFGPYFLSKGCNFAIVSTGALSNFDVFVKLKEACLIGSSQLIIIPGAVGGVDALAAAGHDHIEEVVYTADKPPLSWLGTPAEKKYDLSGIKKTTIIYQGSAREAASLYPKNANVVATIAMAGIGFDRTQVTLRANPKATGNTHHLLARGNFGELDMTTLGRSIPNNPKTSAITAFSIIRTLKNLTDSICV